MNIYWIHTKILSFVAIIFFLITWYVLIVKFKSGLIGAAIATSMAYFLALLIIFKYLKAKRYDLLHPNAWHRFNKDSLNYLGEYLNQGWKIASLKTIGVASFQVLLLYASWIDQNHLWTYIIATACTTLLIQIPLGIGTAAHSLISQALTYRHFSKARKYGILSIIGGVFWGIWASVLFFIFSGLVIKQITPNNEIIELFINLSPYIMIIQILDFTKTVQFGVLEGVGSTIYGAIGVAIFMVIIGIPLPYYFCFTLGYGFRGALIGQAGGLLVINLVFSTKILLKLQELFYFTLNPLKYKNQNKNRKSQVRNSIKNKFII